MPTPFLPPARGGQAVEPIAERPRNWPRLAGGAAPLVAAGPWQEAAGTGTGWRTLSLPPSLLPSPSRAPRTWPAAAGRHQVRRGGGSRAREARRPRAPAEGARAAASPLTGGSRRRGEGGRVGVGSGFGAKKALFRRSGGAGRWLQVWGVPGVPGAPHGEAPQGRARRGARPPAAPELPGGRGSCLRASSEGVLRGSASPPASRTPPAAALERGVPGGAGGSSFPAAPGGFCRTCDTQVPCVASCPDFACRGGGAPWEVRATGQQRRCITVMCVEGEMPGWESGHEERRESNCVPFTCKLGTPTQLR